MYFILLIMLLAINGATHTAADEVTIKFGEFGERKLSFERKVLRVLMPGLSQHCHTINCPLKAYNIFIPCLSVAQENNSNLTSLLKTYENNYLLHVFTSSLLVKYRDNKGHTRENRTAIFAAKELGERIQKDPTLSATISPDTLTAITRLAHTS